MSLKLVKWEYGAAGKEARIPKLRRKVDESDG